MIVTCLYSTEDDSEIAYWKLSTKFTCTFVVQNRYLLLQHVLQRKLSRYRNYYILENWSYFKVSWILRILQILLNLLLPSTSFGHLVSSVSSANISYEVLKILHPWKQKVWLILVLISKYRESERGLLLEEEYCWQQPMARICDEDWA